MSSSAAAAAVAAAADHLAEDADGAKAAAGVVSPSAAGALTSPSGLSNQFEFHRLSSPVAAASASPSSSSSDASVPCPQSGLLRQFPLGWLRFLSLSWMTPLIALGMRRTIRSADLWDCYPEERAANCWREFEPRWEREKARAQQEERQPSLMSALNGLIGWPFLFAMLAYSWVPTDQLLGPQFLNQLVQYSADVQCLLMFLSSVGTAVSNSVSMHLSLRLAFRVRAVLTLLIYRKALRLPSKHRQDGRINNLFTSDTQKILEMAQQAQAVWTSPVILGIAIWELYGQVGWSALLGLAVLIAFFPLAGVLTGKQIKYQGLCAAETDRRIILVNELILGIRVLKYYAWERPFLRVVDAQREKELRYLLGFVYLTSLTFASMLLVPLVMAVVIFGSYVARGGDMTATVVFTTLSLINVVRWPFTMLPMALGAVGQALTALKRIEAFLHTPEINSGQRGRLDRVGIEMKDAQFSWGRDDDEDKKEEEKKEAEKAEQAVDSTRKGDVAVSGSSGSASLIAGSLTSSTLDLNAHEARPSAADEKTAAADSSGGSSSGSASPAVPQLTGITWTVGAGELVMVLGSVGLGKSTLLCGVLGEVDQTAGSTAVGGSVVYVPQTAFIVNASLRDNVLFGQPMEQRRYDAVLQACCLLQDLQVLPNGDLTEIGERGINLSGGQKQRVQLARAAYQQSDIVLLDDPLSAVDSHVAAHIFRHCIDGLMRGRTRVLVTHSLAFVDSASSIVMLKETEVKGCCSIVQGTAQQLRDTDADFRSLLATFNRGKDDVEAGGDGGGSSSGDAQLAKRKAVGVLKKAASVKGSLLTSASSADADAASAGQLMEEEEQETGVVNWQVYRSYFIAGGSLLYFALLPLLFAGAQAIQTASDFWLAQWSNQLQQPVFSTGAYLGVYGALIFGTTAATILRSLFVATFGLRASRGLHHNLAQAVLRKSISWFDRTPGGRIVNRFTKDVYSIDYMIPIMSEYAVSIALQVVGTLIVIAIIVPIMLAVFLPLCAVYLWVTQYYRMSNRDLARLESISRTPVSTHFAETLNGAVSIRALKVEAAYERENERRTDVNTRALYYSQTVSVWLRVRLDVIGSLILGSCAVFAVASVGSTLSPGSFGLLITYALGLTNSMNYAVMLYSMAEAMMNSVERVLHFSRPTGEEDWEATDQQLSAAIESGQQQWPPHGRVELRELQLRYRPELALVLKGVSVVFDAGHRVGVVGRTGSGKSSLLVALFRIVEPAGGSVVIDGVDTGSLSLTALRSRLSIIPQDATLFYGSLRYNLDPFELYSDSEIWQCLQYVQLQAVIARLPLKLSTLVAEAGSNLSAGQRQLLCLARALLRRSRIVCLDEATANVDIETDELIQAVIRTQFTACTVITIAHRLNTVLDYHRILVMHDGQLAEFGTPDELRRKQGGLFSQMLAGQEEQQEHQQQQQQQQQPAAGQQVNE